MKKQRQLGAICGLVSGIQLIAEIMTFMIVWKLNMLPGKYLSIVAGLFVLLWLVVGLLLFVRSRKTGAVPAVRRVFALILATIVVLGCTGVSMMVSELYQTITNVSDQNSVATMMTVYVRSDDPAKSIEEAADYTFGVMELMDAEKTQKAVKDLNDTLGVSLHTVGYPDATQMVDALYAGEVDAILMNSALESMLEELESYRDFSEKTKALRDISIVEQIPDRNKPVDSPEVPGDRPPVGEGRLDANGNPTAQGADITKTPFVVYLSGSDTRSEMLAASRSDVNILVVVHPGTKQILLLNTPRDYFVVHPYSEEGTRDKLTHLGSMGVDCSIQALSELYDERVDFYGQINFTGFESLIDAIGGITVYSDVAFSARGHEILEGENYLNGEQALAFARQRYGLAGGDNARGKNQMKVIKAVIQKLASGAIITNYSSILDSLDGMVAMDMHMNDISKLVKMQLDDMASWNIQSYAVTGEDGSDITYSWPNEYLYVMYPDQGMVDHGAALIDKVLAGEILTEEDVIYRNNNE